MPKSTSRIKNNEQYTRRCDFRSKMFKMPLPLFKHDWTSAHRVRVVDGTLYDIFIYKFIYVMCYVPWAPSVSGSVAATARAPYNFSMNKHLINSTRYCSIKQDGN